MAHEVFKPRVRAELVEDWVRSEHEEPVGTLRVCLFQMCEGPVVITEAQISYPLVEWRDIFLLR